MDSDDDQPVVKAKRRRRPINKKTKLHLVFNEEARREFLTGFSKRKTLRRKKAQEELQEFLKSEKKRIKQEAKERYKKLVHSYKPIPELEEQFAKEYKVEDASVSVLELDTDLLAETNFLIGRNRGQIDDAEVKEEDNESSDADSTEENEMPGMELTQPKKKVVKKAEPPKEAKTRKEIKKELKKHSTRSVKKSKAFQKMNLLHTLKQKKKSSLRRREVSKSQSRGKKSGRGNVKRRK